MLNVDTIANANRRRMVDRAMVLRIADLLCGIVWARYFGRRDDYGISVPTIYNSCRSCFESMLLLSFSSIINKTSCTHSLVL
jgi:hypothetical protein